MGGLYYSAGAFFSFYLIVLSGFFALAGFFRLLGTLCKSYDHAARLASVIITIMSVPLAQRPDGLELTSLRP